MTRIISSSELASHRHPNDLWLAVDGNVYDVSRFARLHPGGAKVLLSLGGNDVTTEFYELHKKNVLDTYRRLIIGCLEGTPAALAGSGAGAPGAPARAEISRVPFNELPAFQDMHSPYFRESHRELLMAVRTFVTNELVPIASEQDALGEYPSRDLKRQVAASGLMLSRMGPGPWVQHAARLGIHVMGGVPAAEFDYFHEMLAHQETWRLGHPGFIDGIGAGYLISAPAIYNFGSEDLQESVGGSVLRGEKNICLAISEPFAGSDVAAIRTTAEKTPDGQHYIVNGVKKWISEGMYADYFVTAVRTGRDGAGGISMLLIERDDSVSTKLIKTTYAPCAGTALVIFDDTKVPASNLLGVENDGFKLVMYNFNHERWMIVNNIVGMARAAVADAFMWANQRKIFGKLLIEQAVIRNKLASSAAALECVQAYLEAITYDMCKTKEGAVGSKLAGPIAMLKYQSTRMAWQVADDTVQILGGRGITRSGMGSRVEGFKNYVKYAAVYGGSEEIMAELAIKQAIKRLPSGPAAKL